MVEPAVGDPVAWRTIDELAGLVGAYCWVEHRLFEVAGAWASEPRVGETGTDAADGELRVWCAAAAQRHAALAGRWAERLPVRAGVDPAALVAPPVGLAERSTSWRPRGSWRPASAPWSRPSSPGSAGPMGPTWPFASPVSEASVMEVLEDARREGRAEIRGGRALLGRLEGAGPPRSSPGDNVPTGVCRPGRFACCTPCLTAPLHLVSSQASDQERAPAAWNERPASRCLPSLNTGRFGDHLGQGTN